MDPESPLIRGVQKAIIRDGDISTDTESEIVTHRKRYRLTCHRHRASIEEC